MRFFGRLFNIISFLSLLVFLPCILLYTISPRGWWVMGLYSIGFIYLFTWLALLAAIWLFIQKRVAAVIFLSLLASFPVLKNTFAFGGIKPFTELKNPGTIRVMQWNCNGLQGQLQYAWSAAQVAERFKAVAFIKKFQPDVICTQDFGNEVSPKAKDNILLMQDTLGYKYYMFVQHYRHIEPDHEAGIGIAIFSKFPIADTGVIFYPFKQKGESIIWADINTPQGKIRFATTHLQSMHLSRKAGTPLDADLWEDSTVIINGSKFDKLRHFQPFHVQEAAFVRSFLDTCTKQPLIFTADLNSVPSSYVYKQVKGQDLQDVFLEKGFGLGRTYHSMQPALRIDYILHNRGISPVQASVFSTTFSDHDPVIMDFTVQ